VDAFMCYKQKCKVVSLNLAHPVYGRITPNAYASTSRGVLRSRMSWFWHSVG